MKIAVNPHEPIQITLDFQTPHVVHYGVNAKKPGDLQFEPVIVGGDDSKSHQTLDPQPFGTKLLILFMFIGGPQTAYRVLLTATQNNHTIGSWTVRGTTNSDGVRVRTYDIELVQTTDVK